MTPAEIEMAIDLGLKALDLIDRAIINVKTDGEDAPAIAEAAVGGLGELGQVANIKEFTPEKLALYAEQAKQMAGRFHDRVERVRELIESRRKK